MKTPRNRLTLLACSLFLLWGTSRLMGDQAHCSVVAAGVRSNASNTVEIVGQTVIGRADNGVVFQFAGAIPCYVVENTCTLGDVNGDGLIDGQDINPYVRVRILGIGTPRELCAANLTVPTFVGMLLGP